MHTEHSAQAPRTAAATAGSPPAGEVGDPAGLVQALHTARRRTLALFDTLPDDALLGPRLPIVNPPLWETGHIGWFQERWMLRLRPDGSLGPSLLQGADALYDSSAVPHATRWDLPLPGPDATRAYLAQVLERVVDRLYRVDSGSAPDRPGMHGLAFHATVCAQHEQMHAEAFTWGRQTLGWPSPPDGRTPLAGSATGAVPPMGDAEFAGGDFLLGARPSDGFSFDNEKLARPVTVEPFAMARLSTSAGEFAAFVDDGGYAERRWWSDEGWAWRTAADARGPCYWRPMLAVQGWEVRWHDAWMPLPTGGPMLHVNAHEADAWCRWAGRRLPSEIEWEFAASAVAGRAARRRHPWGDADPDSSRAAFWYPGASSGPVAVDDLPGGDTPDGCRQMAGNAWEWTSSVFLPYPGFTPDPYRDYSEPWFGSHRVLRGGCFATAASLMRNSWRNFFTPDRRDVFAGFRTCRAAHR